MKKTIMFGMMALMALMMAMVVIAVCPPDWQCGEYGNSTCLVNDTTTAACTGVIDSNGCVETPLSHVSPSPAYDGANHLHSTSFKVLRNATIVEVENIQNSNNYPLRLRVYDDCDLGTLLSTTITENEPRNTSCTNCACCRYAYDADSVVNISVSAGNCLVADYQGAYGGVEATADVVSDLLEVNYTTPGGICFNTIYPGSSNQDWNSCAVAMNIRTAEMPVYNGTPADFPNQTGVCDFCTPSWICTGYGACVSPAVTASCNATEDLNGCFALTGLSADEYVGNYSEFNISACSYPSESSSGTRYLVDANGAVVGVQSGGAIQMTEPVPEEKGTFLSLTGGSSFDVKAWVTSIWSTIKGWFVQ